MFIVSLLQQPLLYVVQHPLTTIACIVAAMVIGTLWYGFLLKKPWGKLSGMDRVPPEKLKRQMFPAMTISVMSALVQAAIMGPVFSSAPSLVTGLVLTFLLWLPFTFCVIATSYAYTMKPLRLLLIDAIYPLLTWLAMATIVYAFRA